MRAPALKAYWFIGMFAGLGGVYGGACNADNPNLNLEDVRSPSGGAVSTGGGNPGSGTPASGSGGGGVSVSSSSSGGGGVSVSSSSSGGMPVPCPNNPGCKPQDAICGAGTCMNEKCVFMPKPLASDVYGDCHKTMCDDQGKVVLVVDDTAPNVYDDGNACTKDLCMNGKPTNSIDFKAICDLKPGVKKGICNTDGLCVECLSGSDCMKSEFSECNLGKCVAPRCVDGMKNDNETDIDCGGSDCAACDGGKFCTQSSDCQNAFCNTSGDKRCYSPSCSDGVKDGAETSIDCGGKDCRPMGNLCPDQGYCALPIDCKSGVCKAGTCQIPSCKDGVKNGNETGIDCGGACGNVPCLPPL